jgi:glutamate formiminotransferase
MGFSVAAERLVECVPNVSEGRNAETLAALGQTLAGRPGVALLDRHADPDHNRAVFTFAGEPAAVSAAAVELAGRAAALIDLNRSWGAHPRIGALDVLPFIPLRGVSMAECAWLAVSAGEEIWRRFRIPVYLYESAARRPEGRNLADVRRGEFEKLRAEAPTNPSRRPDIGGPGLHPTAGAIAAGARKILVAYNINLAAPDASAARRIARRIRESSGGLPCVKAMGLWLPSRGLAQVSTNLVDYTVTPPHVVFAAVRREAELEGVAVTGSELVGLAPRAALEAPPGLDLMWENLHPGSILEDRLAACGLGVEDTG